MGDTSPVPDATGAAGAGPATAGPRAEIPTRRILQALTQLLIEQGVIDRAEFLQRVRRLADGEDDGRPEGG